MTSEPSAAAQPQPAPAQDPTYRRWRDAVGRMAQRLDALAAQQEDDFPELARAYKLAADIVIEEAERVVAKPLKP